VQGPGFFKLVSTLAV